MESTTTALPMRKPVRAPGRRYGQLDMDSMPPATTIFGFAELHRLRRESHGLQSGAADFVDGHRSDARVTAAFERGLASRILAEAGLHHVAEDGFVNLIRL